MGYANNAARRQGWKQGLASGSLKSTRRPPMNRDEAAAIFHQVTSPGGPSYSRIANDTGVPKTTLRKGVNLFRKAIGKKHRAVSAPASKKGSSGGSRLPGITALSAPRARGGRGKRRAA